MILQVGGVVRSIAGHDKNTFHVIVRMEQDVVYLANGKERKLEKPKRKNAKHVAATCTVFDMNVLTTDKKLRDALWPFHYGPGPAPDAD